MFCDITPCATLERLNNKKPLNLEAFLFMLFQLWVQAVLVDASLDNEYP